MNRGGKTLPKLGLVCITDCDAVRYRVLTRARYLKLSTKERRGVLEELYLHNISVMDAALSWCATRHIALYRVTSQLFPFSDEEFGAEILRGMEKDLRRLGRWAEKMGIRVVVHPDQFVVLSSDRAEVIANSIKILERHALAFDLMGLPETQWAGINIHGGKGGRQERLVKTIGGLPANVRGRLTLENDESAYGAAEIHAACVAAGVPMVFDAHHHLVKERLGSYEDPSIREWTKRARETWRPHEEWQMVHLSNGAAGLHDCRHHETITAFPSAFLEVEWVEVEAKRKEVAIEACGRLMTGMRKFG